MSRTSSRYHRYCITLLFLLLCQSFLTAQDIIPIHHFKAIPDSQSHTTFIDNIYDITQTMPNWDNALAVGQVEANGNQYTLITHLPFMEGEREAYVLQENGHETLAWPLLNSDIFLSRNLMVRIGNCYLFHFRNHAFVVIDLHHSDYHGDEVSWQTFVELTAEGPVWLGAIATGYDNFMSEADRDFDTAEWLTLREVYTLDSELFASFTKTHIQGRRDEWRKLFGGRLPAYHSTFQLSNVIRRDIYRPVKEYIAPASSLTYQEAEDIIKRIFDQYYGPYWEENTAASKAVDRASAFLYPFSLLADLRNDFAPAHYNKACMLSLLGRTDEALESLQQAFELDPAYRKKAIRDSDLDNLRSLLEFQLLMKEE